VTWYLRDLAIGVPEPTYIPYSMARIRESAWTTSGFLGPEQTFVNGIEFKEDLKKLNAYYPRYRKTS